MDIDILEKNIKIGSQNHKKGLYICIQGKVTAKENTAPPLFLEHMVYS